MYPGREKAAGPGDVNSADIGPRLFVGLYTKLWLDLPIFGY